ncbi:hypothetical protein L195_g017056 [Trifolium pratense]|uniref:Copia protein n=1 Tax=Trifolium pratense TaxID=57577 RepID=A0A2K3MT46_TRIPR|nr:hypothetical protein L195_g017056 [Trifolium pratense]
MKHESVSVTQMDVEMHISRRFIRKNAIAKPCPTPMQPQLQLSKSHGQPLTDPTAYRRLIERLLYLTHTRSEIAYSISKLSLLDSPTNEHASWFTCLEIAYSTVVSRSSSEAKYRALALATCEVQWLPYLLKDFHIDHSSPIIIYCDNKSALHIAANPVFHERTKHIEIDCHIVRDKIQAGILHLLPVTSKEQIADMMTKSLDPRPFNTLLTKLGVIDIYSSLRGTVKDSEQTQLLEEQVN